MESATQIYKRWERVRCEWRYLLLVSWWYLLLVSFFWLLGVVAQLTLTSYGAEKTDRERDTCRWKNSVGVGTGPALYVAPHGGLPTSLTNECLGSVWSMKGTKRKNTLTKLHRMLSTSLHWLNGLSLSHWRGIMNMHVGIGENKEVQIRDLQNKWNYQLVLVLNWSFNTCWG